MIRIVLDTNVLVSALLQPKSIPAEVLILAFSGQVQLCVSDDVFAEYDEVIRRPHLKRSADVVEKTLSAIRKAARWVKPTVQVKVCSDPTTTCFSNVPKQLMQIIWSPGTCGTSPIDGKDTNHRTA